MLLKTIKYFIIFELLFSIFSCSENNDFSQKIDFEKNRKTSCYPLLTRDEIVQEGIEKYNAYRERFQIPEYWVNSNDCDIIYWTTNQLLDTLRFWKQLEKTECIENALIEFSFKSINDIRQNKEIVLEFIKKVDLSNMGQAECITTNLEPHWNYLIEKYSQQFEKCKHELFDSPRGKYSQVCFFTFNAYLVKEFQKYSYLDEDSFVFWVHGCEPVDDCFPYDYFFRYKFYEKNNNLFVKKELLNPYMLLTQPIW